eukprot:1156225-Pelagomonas_calceolata.AAC.2
MTLMFDGPKVGGSQLCSMSDDSYVRRAKDWARGPYRSSLLSLQLQHSTRTGAACVCHAKRCNYVRLMYTASANPKHTNLSPWPGNDGAWAVLMGPCESALTLSIESFLRCKNNMHPCRFGAKTWVLLRPSPELSLGLCSTPTGHVHLLGTQALRAFLPLWRDLGSSAASF